MKRIFAKLFASMILVMAFVLIAAAMLKNEFEPFLFLLFTVADLALIIYVQRLIDRRFEKKPCPKASAPVEAESPEYRLCKFIWTQAVVFGKYIIQSPSMECTAYLWTAFFYAVTKEIRKQEIVDRIYARFRDSALPFIKDSRDPAKAVDDIQAYYRRFREVLNNSAIDPRTDEGLRALWELTSAFAFPNTQLPRNASFGFRYRVTMIVDLALSLYHLKPKTEPIYYMEAADGMIVRVPESRMEAWQKAQDEIRKNPAAAKLTPKEEELKRRIIDHIYGRDQNGGKK